MNTQTNVLSPNFEATAWNKKAKVQEFNCFPFLDQLTAIFLSKLSREVDKINSWQHEFFPTIFVSLGMLRQCRMESGKPMLSRFSATLWQGPHHSVRMRSSSGQCMPAQDDFLTPHENFIHRFVFRFWTTKNRTDTSCTSNVVERCQRGTADVVHWVSWDPRLFLDLLQYIHLAHKSKSRASTVGECIINLPFTLLFICLLILEISFRQKGGDHYCHKQQYASVTSLAMREIYHCLMQIRLHRS